MSLKPGCHAFVVTSWEGVLVANIIGSSRAWYRRQYARVQAYHARATSESSPHAVVASFQIHSIRGDATNSSTVHGLKSHITEVASVFVVPPIDDADTWEDVDAIRRVYPDLQLLPPNHNAASQRLVYEQQLRCVGLQTWSDPACTADDDCADFGLHHLRVYCFTTDQGPDQKAALKQLTAEASADIWTWILHQYCVDHVLHLIVVALACFSERCLRCLRGFASQACASSLA